MDTIYYVRDAGGVTCEPCTLKLFKADVEQGHCKGSVDKFSRLLAAFKMAEPTEISDLLHVFGPYWQATGRDREAISYIGEIVTDHEPSSQGETCVECDQVLAEPWYRCAYCGEEGYDGQGITLVDDIEPDEDRYGNPRVAFCEECLQHADEDHGAVELLADDGRDYRLTYRPASDRYVAGCRRFALKAALEHWGSPTHHARGGCFDLAPLRLYATVLAHAISQGKATAALTFIED